ncbi:MAG: DUF502 domain-containing protein [Pseudobdellovibrionaceae bacterium]
MKLQYQKIFLRGLVTFLPIGLTIFIIFKVTELVEGLLGPHLQSVLPEYAYIPGLGVIITVILIFFFGLLMNFFIIKGLLENLERRFLQVPLFKAVYSPLKDLMNLFSKEGNNGLKSVVLVQISENVQMMGLITREDFEDIAALKGLTEKVIVYVPWSYGLGGLSLLVNRNQITPVNIPVDRALSLALTAWVKAPKQNQNVDHLWRNEIK